MKNHFILSVLLIVLFFFRIEYSYSQLSGKDSLELKQFNAVAINDSVHSSVPKPIRLAIIKALQERRYNPKEYYTTCHFELNFRNGIHVLRLNGMRFYAKHKNDRYFVGGAGDDDLEIIFDNKHEIVKMVIISE